VKQRRAAHSERPPTASRLMHAATLGFLAGLVVMGLLVARVSQPSRGIGTEAIGTTGLAADEPVEVVVRPSSKERPPAVTPPPLHASNRVAISADPVADLRQRELTLPVHGIERDDLRASFNDLRGVARRHEAIDVLAPRHTPVLAVEGGTIARLFSSEAGGLTIYEFDPTERFVYYYAHLENYAQGLDEGDNVKRGEVIGYVGTSGNAPRDTPHLHFAIFKMTDDKRWWQGTPIDPYVVLK